MALSKATLGRWTKEEDELLRDAMAKYKDSKEISWHNVAAYVPGRNNKDCRKRWVYTLATVVRKGLWDEDEDALLKSGVEEHGPRWAMVSETVVSRQPDQCSRRWHECLNPKISSRRWSLTEDQTLEEAVRVYGRKWTEVVGRFFPDRTPLAAKNRYTQRLLSRDPTGSGPQELSHGNIGESLESPDTLIDRDNGKQRAGILWQVPDYSQVRHGPPDSAANVDDLIEGAGNPPQASASQGTNPETMSSTKPMLDASTFPYLEPFSAPQSCSWGDSWVSDEQTNSKADLDPVIDGTMLVASLPPDPLTWDSALSLCHGSYTAAPPLESPVRDQETSCWPLYYPDVTTEVLTPTTLVPLAANIPIFDQDFPTQHDASLLIADPETQGFQSDQRLYSKADSMQTASHPF